MRAVAACQFTLDRFGAWRAVVVILAASAAFSAVAWFVARGRNDGVAGLLACGLALTVAGAGALLAGRREPLSLRWDTRQWHLGPASTAGQEPGCGDLQVAIDLGPWMLLRWHPDAASRGAAVTWLPVQRRGLESQWHTLRCAVYSPRSAVGVDAAPDA